LQTVPVINRSFIPLKEIGPGKTVQEVVQFLVKMAEGDSQLLKRKREGLVFRMCGDPSKSFKIINPYFLLENDE